MKTLPQRGREFLNQRELYREILENLLIRVVRENDLKCNPSRCDARQPSREIRCRWMAQGESRGDSMAPGDPDYINMKILYS